MKNTFLKTIAGAVMGFLIIVAFAQVSVLAQNILNKEKSDAQTQEDLSAGGANAGKLEGSWDVKVTLLNCQSGLPVGPTTPSMLTFMRGGTMQEIGTRISPSLRAPGHGIWGYQSRGHYTATFQFFRFNADGTLAGRQIVRQEILLSNDGNSFTSSATARVLDAGGNVITNNCSSGVATRFE